MCHVKEFNLSYNCLTGYAVRDKLRNLKKTDPEFWKELTAASMPEPTNGNGTFKEDNVDVLSEVFNDDSNLPCNTIIACVTASGLPETVSSTEDGNWVSVAQAESMDNDGEPSDIPSEVPMAE